MDTATIALIKTKQEELDNLRVQLKKDFIGLDEVVDQIVESIKVWYIFPELQIRPTIICLWGLTGVGKTDLVRKMVSYLKMQDRFLEIEMNGIDGSSQTVQARMEESSLSPEEPCILFLDEYQKFRTIAENGEQIVDNKAYSDVWTLLSDGRFQADLTKKTELLNELLYSKYYADYARVYNDEKEEKKKEAKENKRIYKTGVSLARRVKRLFKLEDSIEEIMKYGEDEIYDLYEQFSKNPTIFEGEVYKKLLIIISGNLDEAYHIAKDVDEVDLDADWYHEYSKRITVLDIKSALTKRFRPEQIARFGNTHILYPSLSKKNYYQIIKMKCNQIGDLVTSTKGIKIQFHESVFDTIYKNGVFPTQGVRPLLSTITNVLSSVLPNYIYNCLLEDATLLKIACSGNKMVGTFKKKKIVIEIPTVLESLREKIDEDSRHVVAVHELGHAVVYTLLFNTVPAQICTDSITSYSNGFILRHSMMENRENILKKLMVGMAGRAAEEMVFGETFASVGAQKDIETATDVAWKYVGQYGFGGFYGRVTSRSNDNDFEIFDRQDIGQAVENLLKEAKEQAKSLLHTNLKFYQTSLGMLMEKGKLSPTEFKDIATNFGIAVKEVKTGEKLILDYKDITKQFLNTKKISAAAKHKT
jgi:cell division protease FtsH